MQHIHIKIQTPTVKTYLKMSIKKLSAHRKVGSKNKTRIRPSKHLGQIFNNKLQPLEVEGADRGYRFYCTSIACLQVKNKKINE